MKEASPAARPEPRVPTPTAQIGAAQAEEVQVKVDSLKYEAILSSRGGRIVSFKLKDYTKSLQGPELVNLFDPEGPDTAGPSIMFTRRDETFNDASLTFDHDAPTKSVTLNEAGAKKSITFKSTTSAGLTIAKTYTFKAENYDVGFSLKLTNASGEDTNYLITFPWRKVYHGEEGQQFSWNSAEILLNGQLKDYYFKDIKGDEEPSGQVEWAGLGDVYFFKALVFGKKPASKVTLFKPSKEGVAEVWVRYGAVDLPQGQPVEMDMSIYLGPKEKQALQAAGDNLSHRPVLQLITGSWTLCPTISSQFLRFCNSGFTVAGIKIPGTHNYGLGYHPPHDPYQNPFHPAHSQEHEIHEKDAGNSAADSETQGKIKDDKAAINKATMELFREQKVNPLGGCWPMFLQLPVFVALYQALSYAIELRHASFLCMPSIYLCINDLAAPDPYYVTPILMGGTMVLQQWMTPSGGDPTQKKMMLLMPVVFTYLFLSFPSGLVLYWLVSNVLSIGQQLITNRMAA